MDKNFLFSPLKLKRITLPGRIVRSGTELFASDPEGHVPPCEFTVYEQLGTQPLGLILTAHTCVSPEGHSNPWQNAVWDDGYIPEIRKIGELSQKNGVPAVMQIGHGGMKAKGNNGGLPVFTPDNMTEEQIRSTAKAFGEAALRVKKAGLSGVMLHGAHLYLLSQFFYPKYNHRADSYGGSALNRFRIVLDCLAEIRKTCGEDFPVFFKINGDDETGSEEYHADLVEALRSAGDGFDAVEISGWNSAPLGIPKKPYFIDNVQRLREELDVPLIEVGGIRSAEDMLAVLDAGASAVSVSRPLLCEPDFPSKIRDSANAVSRCKGCGYCFRPFDRDAGYRCPIAGKIPVSD